MRRIMVSNLVSLDGFFEGPNKEIDWFSTSDDFFAYAQEMLDSIDTILFGRITYEMMAAYWPTEEVIQTDPVIATRMNSRAKIVFSRTLDKVTWNNSRLIKDNMVTELSKLKQQPGKDMVILGSSTIVCALAEAGLIDEYRILVNPVIMGKGNPHFKNIHTKIELQLAGTKTFKTGMIALYYHPKK